MLEFLGYLVSPFLLSGALLSLQIAAVSLLGGLAFGLVLALMRLSRFRPVSAVAWVYIWFIRGTPLLLQLVFLFDVIPAIGIKLDPVSTAMVGFALNEAAFAAEIIRGSILSVNRSQSVAAAALGLPPLLALRRIVLPQAMRSLLPGMGNQTISLIKSTSIASVITGSGNGIFFSTIGISRVESVSLVCVSRSLATTPMSPACNSGVSKRSLPSATHRWFSFSTASRGALYTSCPFLTVPENTRK